MPEAEARMHAPLGDDLWVVNARIRRMSAGDDPRHAEVVVDMHGMYSQAGHAVSAVLRDRSGRIWVGTDFGILLVELLPDRFQRWFSRDEMIHGYGTRTRGMAVVDQRLFVNLDNEGYMILDAQSGELLHDVISPVPRCAVVAAGAGLVWEFNSREMVMRRVKDDAVVRTMTSRTGYVWCGWRAADGTILLGTSAGFHRLGSGPDTERSTQPHFPEINTTPVWHIGRSGGDLLACTASGIYRIDPDGTALERFWSGAPDTAHRLPADDVRHFHIGPDGIHWLATATRGLVKWDRERAMTRVYGRSEGMPQAAVHAVYPDSAGRLWMPTDNGLVRFQPKDERIEVFTARDGISHNEFNRISHARGPDGTLYLGGLNGITVFHPDRFQVSEHVQAAPLILKSLFVQPSEGERAEHTGEVLGGRELVMHPADRFIHLDMVLLSYDEPDLVRYAWRLEGIDEEWNIQREQILRFTTLPYGRHSLRLRGIDREGRWSDELTVPILVLRPIYLRWWFVLGVAGLVALTVYAAVRYRISQLRRVIAVRDRIAMDLHDEVGSNLSGIVLFSSVVAGQRDMLPPGTAAMVDRIARSSTRAIEDMNDIVWSVNSLHDQLSDVIDRMQVYAQPLCDAADIEFHIEVADSLRHRKLGMEQRRALYLVFKEAVTNAVKHAGCTRITVELRTVGAQLELVVEDNGRGVEAAAVPAGTLGGHGLGNMQRRASEVGGSFTMTPGVDAGLRVILYIPAVAPR
jgi:two-component sensor histidine kinase